MISNGVGVTGRLLLALGLVAGLSAATGAREPAGSKSNGDFSTDVPGITLPMLSVDFWIDRLPEDGRRLSRAAIEELNRRNLAGDDHLHDLAHFPDTLPRAAVLDMLDNISGPVSARRYHAGGTKLTDADRTRLAESVRRGELPESVPVRWGLVVERASMRSFPTGERIFNTPSGRDLDRFQETGVFPGQVVALLHESADGDWWFAVNYHYAAWLPKTALAEGARDEVFDWRHREPRLVVTGAQVRTNFNPVDARTSELLLDMGTSLPLMRADQVGHNLHGQNPYASHLVELPVRDETGRLEFRPALVARGRDVRQGALEYRPSTLLRQSFKFLGERYGWGHDYNARDCTGFVGEVYKSVGILMPRNSGQQGRSPFAPTQFFEPGDDPRRQRSLERLQAGDLLYIPGHVMMYIGSVDEEPYIIHDVTGLAYFDERGEFYRGTLAGVSVTPLKPLWLSPEKRLVDSIYAIKSIR